MKGIFSAIFPDTRVTFLCQRNQKSFDIDWTSLCLFAKQIPEERTKPPFDLQGRKTLIIWSFHKVLQKTESSFSDSIFSLDEHLLGGTVGERNPAPPDMYETLEWWDYWYLSYQLVQDTHLKIIPFKHQGKHVGKILSPTLDRRKAPEQQLQFALLCHTDEAHRIWY